MYIYKLPNGLLVDIDRVVDVVLSEGEYPQTYLDVETAAFVEISSPKSLAQWIAEIGKSERYFLIESFNNHERDKIAKDFITNILKDMAPRYVSGAQKALKNSGWKEFTSFLKEKTDGWTHGWDQYIADEAYERARNLLVKNPYIPIKEEFEGCGDCAVCDLIRKGEGGNPKKLMEAMNTENIMNRVEEQMSGLVKTGAKKPAAKKYAKKNSSAAYKKRKKPDKVLSFKITLNDSSPRIWRRIIVPAEYTFFNLHCAIQDAMGWFDCHLHDFRIDTRSQTKSKRKSEKGEIITIAFPNPEIDDFDINTINRKDERAEYLADWFGKRIKQCVYEYDFGDGWDHTVLFESESPRDPQNTYPQCTAGKGACPPEDCGGVWGYKNLQGILKNPKHPEHKDMLDWLLIKDASEFDPNNFDIQDISFQDPKYRLKEYEKRFGVL